METHHKTNFSLAFLLVQAMFIVMFSVVVQANAGGHQLKETKLSLYFHDYSSGGPNSTARVVVGLPGKLWRYDQFGSLYVFDDHVTEGPKLTSTKVGHIQGTSITVGFDGKNTQVCCSLVFANKAYNGSTIEIQGVVNQYDVIQEYGVTSGTGKFRYATGYSTWELLSFNTSISYALIRINATMRHH